MSGTTDALVCAGCGASLPLPDEKGHVMCPSCGRAQIITPRTEPAPTPPPAPTINLDFSGLADVARPAAKASAVGCALGPIIAVITVAIVGGVLFFTLRGAGSNLVGSLGGGTRLSPISGNALVLPGEGANADDVVTLVYDPDDDVRRVARVSLDGSGDGVVWEGKDVDADVYGVDMVLAGKTLFVAAGDSLRAVDPDTGTERWRAALTDKIKTGCVPACLTPAGDGVLVVTGDGQLSSFGPEAAEPRWTRTIESNAPQLLASGSALAIVDDKPDQAFETVVTMVDPATGTVRSTFEPRCRPAGIGASFSGAIKASSPVRFVPGTADLVAVAPGDGCALRWDTASGTVRWNLPLTDDRGFGTEILFSGANAFVPRRESGVVRIDLNAGARADLPGVTGAEVTPTAVVGNLLLAGTKTSRGTAKYGVAAFDLATGTKRWEVLYPKGSQPPSEHSSDALFAGSPRSVLVAKGTTLALVTFDGDARTYAVQAIDLGNGSLTAAEPRSFSEGSGTPSMSVTAVEADRVVVELDSQVLAVPLTAGGSLQRWPDD